MALISSGFHTNPTSALVVVGVVAVVRPRVTLAVPLVSVGFLLAGMGFWPVMKKTGFGRGERWVMVLVAVVGAVGFMGRVRAELRLPIEQRLSRPDDETAVLVFESLHRNMYRAFDYDGERAIYDTLAQSVAGRELERVYREVYGRLGMEEEGGAVSQVEEVDVLEAGVVSNGELELGTSDDEVDGVGFDEGERYTVRAKWRVTGRVLHWGHVHRRTNEYVGLAAVAPSGGAWRIVGRELEEQRRILEEVEGDESDELDALIDGLSSSVDGGGAGDEAGRP